MKISLKWLRDYTPATLAPEEIARRLTMGGVEVVGVERIGERWSNVYVGEVRELKPHPNADRLQLVTAGYGDGRAITVVTGATNLHVGDKVPLALVGATLLDTHASPPTWRELRPAKLRGIVSEGMVCSEMELGLGENHEGIMILDPEAKVGAPLAEELGDVLFDLDVTPNRVDCLSVIGVAREVAALLDEPFQVPSADYEEAGPPIASKIDVRIVDPPLCPRYTASLVEGVAIRQSPKWLRERLVAAGLRPINNVVDVTNYVMLEWGQPLHAFDYDKLHGHQIIVRRAGDGETITLLDGTERGLNAENLVIADAGRAIAVAGVMGGANTEVSSTTHDVLLESANFNPISVRRTSRALRAPTDAAYRFERGLPRELPVVALRRATQLLVQVAGGRAARGIADAYPLPMERPEIFLTPAEVRRLLGIDLDAPSIGRLLERVGCQVEGVEGGLIAMPPLQRTDLTIPADLCEEVARLLGYDTIPSTLPLGRPPEPTINESWRWQEAVRETLVGLGLTEVFTYALTSRDRLGRLLGRSGRAAGPDSFMGPARAAESAAAEDLARRVTERFVPIDVEPIELVNPLSRESETMRTTTFASMLETLRANLRVADRDVALFEIGRGYVPRPRDLPEERLTLTVVAAAYRSAPTWGDRIENDFFWLKGLAEAVLDRLAIGDRSYLPLRHAIFHPTRAAAIVAPGVEGHLVGVLGEVEPDVRAAFDLDEAAFLLALDLEALLPMATRDRQAVPIQRYPPVVQDLAVVVPTQVTAAQIEALVRQTGQPLVKAVDLFDLYQGPPIPAGKINLAYHITYQAVDRTLTGEEVAAVHHRIEQALVGELGAELRA